MLVSRGVIAGGETGLPQADQARLQVHVRTGEIPRGGGGPHLVGVVALMWSANSQLIGNIDRTEQILVQTASPYTGAEPPDECFTGSKPNNAYGYGIVNAYDAVKMALGK